MKIGLLVSQKLVSILISVVMGVLFAMIIGLSVLNLLDYGLPRQLFILTLLSVGLGTFSYILLARSPIHYQALAANNEPGVGLAVRRIFLAVFFLFPITLILYQQIGEFAKILRTGQSSDFIGWLPAGVDDRTFFLGVFALSSLAVLAMVFASRNLFIKNFFNNLPDAWYILFIFFSSLAIRLVAIHLIDTQPLSDFENINNDALLVSQGKNPQNLYATTHVAVTLIYGFLYRVFGQDLIVLKIFHAAVYGLSAIFLYGAGRIMFRSKFWAAVSAVLLVGLPSLAVYSNVITPEHLFILVECAIIYAVVYFFRIWDNTKLATGDKQLGKLIFWAIVVALLIGLSGLFRPFSELFLVAFVITLLVYKLPLKWIAANSLFLLLVIWLAASLPIAVTKYYGHELKANVRPCNLLVGTSFQYAGQYNAEDRALCTKMRDEAPNEEVFAQRVTALVWERLGAQQDELLSFIDRKFAVLWTNSNGILFWSAPPAAARESSSVFDLMRKINYADFVIMLIILIVCALGTVMALFKDVKPGVFFCLLAFWGFNLIEIIFEIQTRYRTVVMPLLIFFACWTFASVLNWMAAPKLNYTEPPDPRESESSLI